MQQWRFLVIHDPKMKEAAGAYYKRAWEERVAPRYRSREPGPWHQPGAIPAAARCGGVSGRAHP